MICIFLWIVEDMACLVLDFLVDINDIRLCCLLVNMTEILLVELAGVAEILH